MVEGQGHAVHAIALADGLRPIIKNMPQMAAASMRVHIGPMTEYLHDPVLIETEKQLNEYFNGQRQCFDVPLDFVGTPFQKQVWNALLTIPFGETRSYGQVAAQIGHHAGSARAVGAANGRNPISIIAPCHRVIGASGDLIGFAGGLNAKQQLLLLESGSEREDGQHPLW